MAITELVATALGFGSLTQLIGTALAPKYGIYAKTIDDTSYNPIGLQEGDEVFVVSSWVKVEYIADSSMSTAPTEQGSYTSFNKVSRPAELRVLWSVEGWLAFDGGIEKPFSGANVSRKGFLECLEVMKNTAYTYNITTPDKTYSGFDMTHYDYQVTSNNGVTLLLVNAFFQEVRETMESSISSTSGDSGTATSQAGTESATLDEAQAVDSNIVQSTDSLKDAVAKIVVHPASNLRSAITTVATNYSAISQTTAELLLKNVVTGIGTGLM